MKKEVIQHLLYMAPSNAGIRDLAGFFNKEGGGRFTVQLWEFMGVLELEAEDKMYMDFELTDEETASEAREFFSDAPIKYVYALTASEGAFQKWKPDLKSLVRKFGGFFCSDTEDFMPLYKELQ